VDVGAARGLAHGVKIQAAQIGFHGVQGIEVGRRFARPFGEAGTRRINLDEHLEIFDERLEPGAFEVNSHFTDGGRIEGADQHAHGVFIRSGREDGGDALVPQRFDNRVGRGPLRRGDLQIAARNGIGGSGFHASGLDGTRRLGRRGGRAGAGRFGLGRCVAFLVIGHDDGGLSWERRCGSRRWRRFEVRGRSAGQRSW
jgi:hypothetical protein